MEKTSRLGLSSLVTVTASDRVIKVDVDEEYLSETAKLDGCYALKTDLSHEAADKEAIHARYKDLAMVEHAFRMMKTGLLEVRPVYVRRADRTRGHVLVVMLAYLIVRDLEQAWRDLDITVKEGLEDLNRLCALEISIKGGGEFMRLPEPAPQTKALLKALGVQLPAALPKSNVKVDTKKKLGRRQK
jgi:hypothetical protein